MPERPLDDEGTASRLRSEFPDSREETHSGPRKFPHLRRRSTQDQCLERDYPSRRAAEFCAGLRDETEHQQGICQGMARTCRRLINRHAMRSFEIDKISWRPI